MLSCRRDIFTRRRNFVATSFFTDATFSIFPQLSRRSILRLPPLPRVCFISSSMCFNLIRRVSSLNQSINQFINSSFLQRGLLLLHVFLLFLFLSFNSPQHRRPSRRSPSSSHPFIFSDEFGCQTPSIGPDRICCYICFSSRYCICSRSLLCICIFIR